MCTGTKIMFPGADSYRVYNRLEEMTVLVFSTGLSTEKEVKAIKPFLDAHSLIVDWSVDLEDCDRVLRVVGNGVTEVEIIRIMEAQGVACKILP